MRQIAPLVLMGHLTKKDKWLGLLKIWEEKENSILIGGKTVVIK